MKMRIGFIAGSLVRLSIRLAASVLLCAALLVSSQAALAQFTQQGSKLVGATTTGPAAQGASVAVSADGNTAVVGGPSDNGQIGAAWVYTRSGEVWSQQGSKLVGTGAVGIAWQGVSVALSADGNTAIVGGQTDNNNIGAVWVFTRSGGVWTQQGSKLVGTGAVGNAEQGISVGVSADGNTAIVGGPSDGANGAAWVFTRSGGVWSQQGNKLIGTGAVGNAAQGWSVALSGDGNTAMVGGVFDNSDIGAVWVFTRSGGVWSQQGSKLVGTGASGGGGTQVLQGNAVALSADGNTAIVGGQGDNNWIGAVWVFTRSDTVWSQQGSKLIGTGAVGSAGQGGSVALSADGNTTIVGGFGDNPSGAAWVFTRSGGVWTQQGSKLVGTGAVGTANQGTSVALSADGLTAIAGGPADNSYIGAAWVFVQVQFQVTPATNIESSGPPGGPFSPSSFQYQLSAPHGDMNYSITGIPSWLNAAFTSGTATVSPVTDTFSLTNVGSLASGTYTATISFTNTTNGSGNTTRTATLTVALPEEACAVVPNTLSSPEAGRPEFSIPDPCARPRAR